MTTYLKWMRYVISCRHTDMLVIDLVIVMILIIQIIISIQIKKHISSQEKPVLFAHDTTSFCNNKNDTKYNNVWGYKFNSIIQISSDWTGMESCQMRI